MKLLLFSLILSASCFAEECALNYWQVVPSEKKCEIYRLPDFDLRAVEHPDNTPQHIKQFCNAYEITSKFGKQRSNYCYTGEGERTGPTFRLGDESWSFSSSNKDRVYFADFNFSGCQNGKQSQGIVFGLYGWALAPGNIQRSWPLEKKIVKCASE